MKGILTQASSVFVISLGQFVASYGIAWSSEALITLESDYSPLGTRISNNDGSLLGSLLMLGCFLGTLYCSWLADSIGRKKTIILDALLFALSWAIVSTASSIKQILVGRFLIGLATGMHLTISLPYISEFAQTSIRGTLNTIAAVLLTFGTLVSYLTGWMCSYEMTNYLPLSLSVIFVVLICFLKESPAFLMVKGDDMLALKSLQFYRGLLKSDPKLLEEFNILRRHMKTSLTSSSDTKTSAAANSDHATEAEHEQLRAVDIMEGTQDISPWKLLLSSKAYQRAILIATFFLLCMVFAGTIVVQAYAGQIFLVASPSLSPHLCSVFIALAFAVGAVVSVIVSDLFGRRILFITSAVLSSACLAILASLLRWRWLSEKWVPVFLLGYCFSFQVGVSCVPLMQLAEIFVPKLKSLTTVLAMVIMWIGNFIIMAAYGPVVDGIGHDGTFMGFSLSCAGSAVAAYFLMRETKGVPVENIEKMFEDGFLYRRNK